MLTDNYYIYWLYLENIHTDMLSEGYIGVSKNPKQRFKGHINKTQNAHLKNAILKYKNNIKMKILLCGYKEYCFKLEEKLRPHEQIGWNINKGGTAPPINKKGKGKGKKMPPSPKKGKTYEEIFGKERAEKIIKQIKINTIGKPKPESHKEKTRKNMKGNTYWLGRAHKEETKKKISKKILYDNIIYYGWNDLKNKTGLSRYMYYRQISLSERN